MDRSSSLRPIVEIARAYLKADRWLLSAVLLAILLSSLVSVAAPILFARLVDALSQAGPSRSLLLGFLAYAALSGASMALPRIAQSLAFMSAENLSFIVNTRFFERVLRKTGGFFVEHNSAEIQSASQEGCQALSQVADLVLVALLPGGLQILLAVATLGAKIDLEILVIVAVHGTVSVALAVIAIQRVRPHLDAAIEAGQDVASLVGNAIGAMETLRIFGRQDWLNQRFAASARLVRDNILRFIGRRLPFVTLSGVTVAIQLAVTYWLLLPRHEAGSLSLGDLVLFNMLVLQLNAPFEMVGESIDTLVRSRARVVPLLRMWAAPEMDAPGTQPLAPLSAGCLRFEAVAYRYETRRGLAPLSFSARRGAITFLVGETGAGKSTVFRLALKMLEPTEGRILIDGTDLATIDSTAWTSQIAIVPQDVVLLNESLADNILLGRPRDEARLHEAAEKAAILPFISSLPEGFDTNVGERGLKLSGGERQRIAIARALYSSPALLFLDEASAALDDATEADIMQHIRRIAASVTVLAITHRRSVITPADQVVTLTAPDGEGLIEHEGAASSPQ